MFYVGRELSCRESVEEVIGFGYLAPLAAVAAVALLAHGPAPWPVAARQLRWFFVAVVVDTPRPAYLVCLAYACFIASRKKPGKGFYR